jgi:multicomponent K+:H+ antiporter subunit C
MTAAIGLLTALGVYLLLRARTFAVILGLMMLSYAVNLFLLAMGRLRGSVPPVLAAGGEAAGTGAAVPYADPVPQALILTAIVIGFAMSAFVIVLAIRARIALGTDHVDGREPERRPR